MTQEYPVGGDRMITVETSSGDIVVEGGDVQSLIVRNGDDIRVKDKGSTLSVRASRGGSRDIHITVPTQCSLLVRSASGDITISDVGGQVSAKSMSGQISCHRVRGRFEGSSMSGDIVLLASRISSLDLDTVSGDGLAETSLDVEGQYRLNAVSGDLTLRIPEDQGCDLRSNSVSGSMKCKLPYDGQLNKRGHGRLVVNGGGPAVKMNTTSGDMRIRAAKDILEADQEPAAPEPFATDTAPLDEPFVPEPEAMSPFEPVEASEPITASRETHRLDQTDAEPFGVAAEEPAPEESPAERRMAILKQIEKGDMTVAEGLAKLRALD